MGSHQPGPNGCQFPSGEAMWRKGAGETSMPLILNVDRHICSMDPTLPCSSALSFPHRASQGAIRGPGI